jgi:AraC-like DNA-binding protein
MNSALMTIDAASPEPTLRFSTEELPPRDRTAIWHEMISRCLMRVEVGRPSGQAPFHELSMWALPGVSLVFGRGAACTASRTRSLVSDGNDEILLNVNASGHAAASWLGREVELQPGEAILVPTADVGGMRFNENFNYLNLRLPRSALAAYVSDVDATLMRPVPADSEALRLLIRYAQTIRAMPLPASPELQQLLAVHLRDLLAQVVGATGDAAAIGSERGVAAARLAAIKADILGSLNERRVKAVDVATRHGISPVYVHKLFAREGTTLSAYVLGQRLQRVHRALSNPSCDHLGIAAIAFEAGFDDLSYFNRRFRRRFNATPSDVRALRLSDPIERLD